MKYNLERHELQAAKPAVPTLPASQCRPDLKIFRKAFLDLRSELGARYGNRTATYRAIKAILEPFPGPEPAANMYTDCPEDEAFKEPPGEDPVFAAQVQILVSTGKYYCRSAAGALLLLQLLAENHDFSELLRLFESPMRTGRHR